MGGIAGMITTLWPCWLTRNWVPAGRGNPVSSPTGEPRSGTCIAYSQRGPPVPGVGPEPARDWAGRGRVPSPRLVSLGMLRLKESRYQAADDRRHGKPMLGAPVAQLAMLLGRETHRHNLLRALAGPRPGHVGREVLWLAAQLARPHDAAERPKWRQAGSAQAAT